MMMLIHHILQNLCSYEVNSWEEGYRLHAAGGGVA